MDLPEYDLLEELEDEVDMKHDDYKKRAEDCFIKKSSCTRQC